MEGAPRVVTLPDVPDPAADVSSAVVVADEWDVILGYRVTNKAPRISAEPPKVCTYGGGLVCCAFDSECATSEPASVPHRRFDDPPDTRS